jgi:hypothetical protein
MTGRQLGAKCSCGHIIAVHTDDGCCLCELRDTGQRKTFVSLATEYDGVVWVNPDCVSSVVPVQDELNRPKNSSLVYMVGGQMHVVDVHVDRIMERLTGIDTEDRDG